MMPISRSTRRLIGVAVLLSALVSCQSAASVFLDVPPPSREEEEPANRSVRIESNSSKEQADTVRPPIESVQSPDSVLALLPRSPDGSVDWVQALRTGTIQPRSAPGDEKRGESEYRFGFDFYLGEFEAFFPHSAHTEWLECASCHPGVYRKRGTSASMQEMAEGESCGRCHGSVAFGLDVCERCHTALTMPEARVEATLGPEVQLLREVPEADTVRAGTESFPPSVFAHGIHRIRYTCAACHSKPFPLDRAPPGTFDMTEMQSGETCGECHNGKAAFGVLECARCHRPVRTMSE